MGQMGNRECHMTVEQLQRLNELIKIALDEDDAEIASRRAQLPVYDDVQRKIDK
jgi:hypothetical protein